MKAASGIAGADIVVKVRVNQRVERRIQLG
jgi:hypothetical protein